MRKLSALLAAAALAGGAWLLADRLGIPTLDALRLARQTAPSPNGPAPEKAPARAGPIRIASFRLSAQDEVPDPRVIERVAQILGRFEVVALQGICAATDEPLLRWIEALQAGGRDYEYVASRPIGRAGDWERYAVVFDAARIEVDRTELYVVNDPDDLLLREPLAAWLRTRGPTPEAAFTFTLVNVQLDPQFAAQELPRLIDVFNQVRRDGRGEDDVILAGAFYADDRSLVRLTDLPGVVWAISHTPTTTRGEAQLDNLVFDARAVNEFTGRVGVFDFLREFNLRLDEALEISEHLPVWAEFSAYEGRRR